MADDQEKQQAAEAQQEEQGQEQEVALKDRITADVEGIGTLRKKVTVTVPRDAIDERLEKSYSDLLREAVVPGFRKGRAPRGLIQKRFGKDIADEVRTKLIAEAYEAAVEKTGLDVLGEPQINLDAIQLPEEGELQFSCEVEVKPQFELPSLEGIEVKKPSLKVTDEDITREIDRFRALRGTYQAVDEGAKADDMITADVVVRAEGQEIRKLEAAPMYCRARAIEGMIFQNFGEVVQGATPGQTRTLEGTLPEDYEKEEFRGKPATVEVTVKEVKRMVLPPLDKDMLSNMGFESEEELRNFIRDRLTTRLDSEVRRAMQQQVYGYLLENVKLELPEALSGRQTDRVVMRRLLQLRSQGVPEAEIEKQMDELRTRAGEQARNDLKLFFIMNKIAEQLEVDVSEGELNGRIAAIAQTYNRRFDRVRDEMIKDGSLESLYIELRDEKSVDKILEKARIVEQEVPKQ